MDLRQANAILHHKPDIIIFEAPNYKQGAESIFNQYKHGSKPAFEIKKIKNMLHREGRHAPWALSDIRAYDNIQKLWNEGHDIKLFNVDGPPELLKIGLDKNRTKKPTPYRRGTHFVWWVRIYLRERIMANNIKRILIRYSRKRDLTALVFLQKFHWRNVKFLLSKPSKSEIWNYYFHSFKGFNRKNITEKIRRENSILYEYWMKISDFV